MNQLPESIEDLNLIFSYQMMNHPDLGCLRKFQVGGKIPVKPLRFTDTESGRLIYFSPIDTNTRKVLVGVERCAFSCNFEIPPKYRGNIPTTLKELLSL